jgi:8-oxo-dGTP diphosphatase
VTGPHVKYPALPAWPRPARCAILHRMRRIPCVGGIVTDASGRILLIERGHPPQAGRWSLPGGRVEPGETDEQALVREMREETGLLVRPGGLAGTVERPGPAGTVLVIRDYTATVTGGELVPGDDATGACWAGPAELAGLPLTRGLLTALTAWGLLGTQPPAALIAEATRRAGILWLAVAGQDRPYPAWHRWAGGAACLVTGPGEQPLPGLAAAGRVAVTVTAGDAGGQHLTWQARVDRVEPGSPQWQEAAGQLVAGRLNPVLAPGETSPEQRWATAGAIYRLTPLGSGRALIP